VVLLIDDDVALGISLEKVFRFDGLDAVSVRSGTEAISMLSLRKPKLIILDLKMPLMDGMTILRAIRSDPQFKSVPILIYTSDFSEESRALAINAGAQDFIVKGTVGWKFLVRRAKELIADQRVSFRFPAQG
jgi:DNA-binding response OmpR family regulator